MTLIAIKTDSMQQGEFVFGAIDDAVAAERIHLDDVALVGPGEKDIEVHHRKGRAGRMFGAHIDDGQAKRLHGQGPSESAVVLVLGDEAEAVARRVRTITGSDLKTYAVDGDQLTELTGADSTYALDDSEGALLEEPGVTGGDDDLPRGRLSRP